jgi:hypothetical protein
VNLLASSPDIYPQKLDLARQRVLMIRMTQVGYRAASFLDDRMLTAETRGRWIELEAVLTQAPQVRCKPLHYIFHIGHAGSTLLSRLLDEAADVLSLREPLPLRTLADAFDEPEPDLLRDRTFEAFLYLWSRGYAETRAVVLKATSNTARMGAQLLDARPDARAVYLSLAAKRSIETLLSGQSSAADINLWGSGRFERLKRMLAEYEIARPQTLGELAAMTWLVERLTCQDLVNRFGERLLQLDFEDLLAGMPALLERVLLHFGLDISRVSAALQSPVSTHYSKKPSRPFSAERRAQVLAVTRIRQAEEISRAHIWLEKLATQHKVVAELLA